jgi:hypothetical protein
MMCVLRVVISGLSRLIPTITRVQKIIRLDHAQLTVKMIAGAIKQELADDMTLTIKIIFALLRAKFSDVNPSYDG